MPKGTVVYEEQANSQKNENTSTPRTKQDWIQILLKQSTTIHKNLKASDGAWFYNSGTKRKKTALKTATTTRPSLRSQQRRRIKLTNCNHK